jgi:hypothetical protein
MAIDFMELGSDGPNSEAIVGKAGSRKVWRLAIAGGVQLTTEMARVMTSFERLLVR